MNDDELKQLLKDPKRILNIVRVFHQVLHQYDKMEEQKAQQPQKNPGVTSMAISDTVELTLKDGDGNIKEQKLQNIHKKEVKK